MAMSEKRITLIPFLHGKVTRDGKLSEPDIDFILKRWLERHPEVRGRERDIRISRGGITLPGGVQTESVRVTITHSMTWPATIHPRTPTSTSNF
jgi:hypothetical protein